MNKQVRVLAALALVLPLLGPLQSCRTLAQARPDATATPATATRQAMVVAANPLAAQAGLDVLRSGGLAADAAVAVQAMLGLVEPQSSGLGGGAFITYYDAHTRTVTAYSGRETAPALASPDMFLDASAHPLPFASAVLSGRATGVPGAIAALGLLQGEHGRLAWRDLFAAAERRATEGFIVSPRLARFIASSVPEATAPDVVHYFSKPDGTRISAGDLLVNAPYAASLRQLSTEGAAALYHGPIAADIVRRVHDAPLPGSLSLEDLAHFRPIEASALCRPWRTYQVCTPPLPAGGVGVLQALLLLDHTDIDRRGPDDPIAWVQLGEAERLMYADRNRYVGDPAFVPVPLEGLLDPGYLRARAALIADRVASAPPAPGNPPGARLMGPDHTVEPGGTTQFVIVDEVGNVVSMTTTVESIFGTGRMVDGFFLNNQLTDFSFSPTDADGRPAANAVAPGKRPRSAMSPTIVLDAQGRFVAALGSAGGPAIIAYILKTMIGTFDWHLSMGAAIALPNLVVRGGNFAAETARFAPGLLDALNARGMDLHPGEYEESGLQGVRVRADGSLDGAADPRREGVALAY
jgi:gamma-glutamyltranspeptidase/glutathione hydrolase